MKFTKLFFAIAAFAAIATSCETPFEEPEAQGKIISLRSTMDNFTKATDTAFEEGDQIGLHIVIPQGTYLNNKHFTYTNDALVGDETYYWYPDESIEADVLAYYPYSATGSYSKGGYNFTVNADQSKAGNFTASDLMVAATTSKPTAEAVELPFRHALSKVVVKIDNQLEETIDNVWFSEVYGTATVNLKSGDTAVSGRKGTIKTASVTTGGEQAWALILVPQENVSPKLIVTTASEKQYTFQLSGEVTFSAGKVSTATITLSDDTIYTAFTPTISDWTADNDLQFGQSEDGGNTDLPGGDDDNKEGNVIYFHPNMWGVDGAWFVAHAWDEAGTAEDVTLTDNDGDGVFEGTFSAGMTNILFCRMDPAVSSFSWEVGIWNQTVDLTISAAPNNHFHITSWDNGEWHDAEYVFDNSTVASGLGVVGSFAASNWETDVVLMGTDDANVLVAKGIEFRAYDAFKIRTAGTWEGEINLGAGSVNYIQANKYTTAVAGSVDNIIVEAAGTYDIYFNQNTLVVYVMTAGTDIAEATEQTVSGAAPNASTMSWGLVGVHNNWGSPDIPLVWDGTIGLYVAKSATLAGEFKVRADESWSTNFGGATIAVDTASASALTFNSGTNCTIAAGTYDVYFWFNPDNIKGGAKIWVRSEGMTAPTL